MYVRTVFAVVVVVWRCDDCGVVLNFRAEPMTKLTAKRDGRQGSWAPKIFISFSHSKVAPQSATSSTVHLVSAESGSSHGFPIGEARKPTLA